MEWMITKSSGKASGAEGIQLHFVRCFVVPILSFVSLSSDGVADLKRLKAKERSGVRWRRFIPLIVINCHCFFPSSSLWRKYYGHEKLLSPSHLLLGVAAVDRSHSTWYFQTNIRWDGVESHSCAAEYMLTCTQLSSIIGLGCVVIIDLIYRCSYSVWQLVSCYRQAV